MSAPGGRTNKELVLILEGLKVPMTVEALEQVRKGCHRSLSEEMSLLAIRATKSTPEQCNFEYDAEENVVRPLRESRAENLRYLAQEVGLDEMLVKLSTDFPTEKRSRPERLYILFEEGTIGCTVDAISNPHVSNIYYMDHSEKCCYPLSSKDGIARLGPIIVQKASRTSKLSLEKEAQRILECRTRIIALLLDGTNSSPSGEKKKKRKEEKKSHKRKRHHSESESSEREVINITESSDSSSYSLSVSDSDIGDSISVSSGSSSSSSEAESESSEERVVKKKKKGPSKHHHHHHHHEKKEKKKEKKEKRHDKEKKEKKHKKPVELPPTPPPPQKREKVEKAEKKEKKKVDPVAAVATVKKPTTPKPISLVVTPTPTVKKIPPVPVATPKPVKQSPLPSAEETGKLTERLSVLNEWMDVIIQEPVQTEAK